MEKTERELIREALNDHPRHIFWDGCRKKSTPLTAREVFKMLGKEIPENVGRIQFLQGQD